MSDDVVLSPADAKRVDILKWKIREVERSFYEAEIETLTRQVRLIESKLGMYKQLQDIFNKNMLDGVKE